MTSLYKLYINIDNKHFYNQHLYPQTNIQLWSHLPSAHVHIPALLHLIKPFRAQQILNALQHFAPKPYSFTS